MSERNDPVEQAILSYLIRNPRAQDTLSGIADWWLDGLDEGDRTPRRIEQAVERLQADGLLAAARGADGRVRYRLAAAHLDAARRTTSALDEGTSDQEKSHDAESDDGGDSA